MKLQSIRIHLAPVIILCMIFLAFLPLSSEGARIKPLYAGKDVKGILFEDFWKKALEEAAKWGGAHLKVRRILSLSVVGFDGRNGRSAAWEAQFVRCDRTRVPDQHESVPAKRCKGRTITLRMIEAGVSGTTVGLQISKETQFRGVAMPLYGIAISPQQAEVTANAFKHYNPVETDTYAYELKYDHPKEKPTWVIKRTCGYKGKAEGRCVQGDYWIVKIDAESGEVVKSRKNPSRIQKAPEDDDSNSKKNAE